MLNEPFVLPSIFFSPLAMFYFFFFFRCNFSLFSFFFLAMFSFHNATNNLLFYLPISMKKLRELCFYTFKTLRKKSLVNSKIFVWEPSFILSKTHSSFCKRSPTRDNLGSYHKVLKTLLNRWLNGNADWSICPWT